MKILVAGATGAVGRRLVPLLTAAGHEVAGMTRSPAKADLLLSMGAKPVIADALDPAAMMNAVRQQKPEIVVHELTSIEKVDLRNFDRGFAATNRLRQEGTDHLLAAARAPGVRRFVAQSFAGWTYARVGGPVDGLVLRYGAFYGPGTAISQDGWMANDVRRRRIPVIGGGGGVWSFIHIDDAAHFTLATIERGAPGGYNIVDDDPAPVSQWLPALAAALGAKPPLKVPAWIARFMIGDAIVFMTDVRGASNAKAKQAFGLNLIWPSWRDGFKEGLGDPSRT